MTTITTEAPIRSSRYPQLSRPPIVLWSMGRLAALLALLLLPLTPAAQAARRHQAQQPCHLPPHARILTANTQAMIYEPPETIRHPHGIFGCTYGNRHTYYLGEQLPSAGTPGGIMGITLETLSGSIVAYEGGYGDAGGAAWIVTVRNLRNGQILHKTPTGPSPPPSPPENGEPARQYVGIGPVKSIVVKSDGAVAWIVETGNEGEYYQVRSLDKSGERLLASESDISPSSLAIAGSTLYWTQGGKPFSAALN
jgi:hypothetical protein